MINVAFIQRKRRPAGNYSIEFIFEDVRRRLSGDIEARERIARFESSGLFRRLYIGIEAALRQADVNHVTGDINYAGILLRKDRTIQTILDCGHLDRTTGLRQAILKLLWVRLPIARCAWVTAISEATKAEVLRYVPSCDPAKIVVIPVAISERFTRKDKPFNAAKPRILQIGTAPNKNIPRLVEALKGVDCFLDVVGKFQPEYHDLLKRSGISYSYVEGLSAEEIVRKYEEADILTLVSTYEGYGMPILEAQATGRPVITSDLLSMPEVAGEGACLVDPFDVDAIRAGFLKIIRDEAYRTDLVAKGFENAKRFEPNTIARQYLELYRRVMPR